MALSDHSAPGSNAGFSFQFERALFWLVQSPAGSIVGIETSDDVAIQTSDGAVTLEQDKHSIREGVNPLSDRSKALWNTLATWVDALDAGEVKPEITSFLMVTNQAVPDCVASSISAATSEADADKCIAALEAAAKEPSDTIKSLTRKVLATKSRESLRQLIIRCKLSDANDASAARELRKKTIAELQLPEWCCKVAESIVDELLGWLHRTTLEQWQQNKPAWIKRDHLINQLHAIIERRRRQTTRERAETLIPVPESSLGEKRGTTFVKQLYLVSDDDSLIDTAIREFIRCNIEKSRLSAEGTITDADWLAFEAALFSRWVKIRARVIRMNASAREEDVGFEILTETTEDYCENLAGEETDQVYLTAGTYHRLAENLDVGWHPRYEELLAPPNLAQ
jgi:hypothetical protein